MLECYCYSPHQESLLGIVSVVHARRLRVYTLRQTVNRKEILSLYEHPERLHSKTGYNSLWNIVSNLRSLETDIFSIPYPEGAAEAVVSAVITVSFIFPAG